jgi:hypothetical protein
MRYICTRFGIWVHPKQKMELIIHIHKEFAVATKEIWQGRDD